MGDGHRVVDAELPDQRELPGAGRRHDAVDHRVGEWALRVDPLGQVRVGGPRERHHAPAQHRTVALQVVAAQSREGGDAPIASRSQRRHHRAERGARAIRVGGVVPDVGMRRVEVLRCRMEVVAALGHRQGDDADCGIAHPSDEGGVSLLHPHVVDHRAHHLCRLAGGVELDQRRQAVLPQELLALRRVVGTNPRTDDCPVVVETELEQAVQVPGLVRAVKVAESDVDDPRGQGRAVVAWPRNGLRQVRKRGVRKTDHGFARDPASRLRRCAAPRRRSGRCARHSGSGRWCRRGACPLRPLPAP